jgi:hypothetical protein
MKVLRLLIHVACAVAATSATLHASPTMIRLGYTDCAACHISPQGAGLLTSYGKGIDEAQSLRAREVTPIDTRQRRMLFDVRFLASSQMSQMLSQSRSVNSSDFRAQLRSSLKMTERNRISSVLMLESPTLAPRGSGLTDGTAARAVLSKALWEYRPKEGVEFAIGRDEMPSGIGLPDPLAFIRSGSDPNDTRYPTQIKAFLWNERFQLTPYVFGPGGDEPDGVRQYGGGVVGGVDIWKRRAVVGLSTRLANAETFDRRSVGAFARLGFGKWGILAEHDLTSRAAEETPGAAAASRHLAGHTQVFFAPKEWLVTSLAAEHLVANGAAAKSHTYRLTPGVQARISDNLTLILNVRDVFTGPVDRRSRVYSLQVAVKSVQ